jgi:hypothetical protein
MLSKMMLAKRTQKNFEKSFAKIRQFKIKVVPLHPLSVRKQNEQLANEVNFFLKKSHQNLHQPKSCRTFAVSNLL